VGSKRNTALTGTDANSAVAVLRGLLTEDLRATGCPPPWPGARTVRPDARRGSPACSGRSQLSGQDNGDVDGDRVRSFVLLADFVILRGDLQ
jgi:hypothetical protein